MTKKTAKSSRKPKSLKVERIFYASPQALWSYWTEPEKFAKWFNPAPGIDLVIHEYDVRVGGRVRFDMPQPDGSRNPQEGVFHVIRPHREIVSGAPDKSFLIAVKFVAIGKRTRMAVTMTGVPRRLHVGAAKGWNAGFDKLAGLLPRPPAEGIRIERVLKGTPEHLWTLWTTKGGIESWWGPQGFTTVVRKLDLRLGGSFEYEMTAVGAQEVAALKSMGMPLTTAARNVYTEVAPPRRLAYKTRIDFFPDVDPYEVTAAVEFRRVPGGTRLVFLQEKMHDPGMQRMAREGQMSQLDKLAKVLAHPGVLGRSSHSANLTLPSDREILISRIFDTPRERVFRAHVDPKAIGEWWGPREYANTVDRWEPRQGGAWRIVQKAPDGKEHGFHGVFQEIAPPERLTWTFEYEGAPGQVVTETTTFEEQPGGRTKLTVRALFSSRADRNAMLDSGMEWGMRQSYERLDEMLDYGGRVDPA